MTAEPCRHWRGDVAAFALGRLDPDEVVRLQAHLDGCATCRAALDELRRTARALPLADPARLNVAALPPSDLADRILREVRHDQQRMRTRRRRRVLGALAGAVAAAAAVVLLLAAVTRDDGRAMTEFAVEGPGVEASFALHANAQGTAVQLEHQGLDTGEVYWLWLTDSSGKRVSAGTFLGSAQRASLNLQSALPESSAVRIWVTDADDEVVLDSPVTH
jgi:anti-sigma factor RsiW